jgi:hypothetical protein
MSPTEGCHDRKTGASSSPPERTRAMSLDPPRPSLHPCPPVGIDPAHGIVNPPAETTPGIRPTCSRAPPGEPEPGVTATSASRRWRKAESVRPAGSDLAPACESRSAPASSGANEMFPAGRTLPIGLAGSVACRRLSVLLNSMFASGMSGDSFI